jgi:hypothetical protein
MAKKILKSRSKKKNTSAIHRLVSRLRPKQKTKTKAKTKLNPDDILTSIPKTLQKKIDEVIKLTGSTHAGLSDLRQLANKILEHAADISSNLKKKIK